MEHILQISKRESKINRFKICLLKKISQNGEDCARGEIRINDFSEVFFAPLTFWNKIDYYKSWIDQLSKLDFSGKAFLATTMYPLESANFIFGWSIYVEDEWAYLQNNMVILENLSKDLDIHKLDEAIPPRTTVTDEGLEISEWKTTRKSINDFSLRLRKKIEKCEGKIA